MAKVVVNYDSENKECEATIDGEVVDNCYGVAFYKSCCDDGKWVFEASIMYPEEGGLKKYTRICAKDLSTIGLHL